MLVATHVQAYVLGWRAEQVGGSRRDAERPHADDPAKMPQGTAPAARAALPVIVGHLSGPWVVMPAAWAGVHPAMAVCGRTKSITNSLSRRTLRGRPLKLPDNQPRVLDSRPTDATGDGRPRQKTPCAAPGVRGLKSRHPPGQHARQYVSVAVLPVRFVAEQHHIPTTCQPAQPVQRGRGRITTHLHLV